MKTKSFAIFVVLMAGLLFILPGQEAYAEKPIVFDKSRGWPAYLELAEFILERKVKVLVPVRPIVDVLASFEKLYRKNAHNWQFPQEKTNFADFQTVEGRAGIFMKEIFFPSPFCHKETNSEIPELLMVEAVDKSITQTSKDLSFSILQTFLAVSSST